MSSRIQGGDAYENAILRPERGIQVAPRITAGYGALVALLSDGKEHPRQDCRSAVEESGELGLAPATASAIFEKAIYYGQIVGRFGYEQRIGASGRPRNFRVYVAYRLTREGLRRAPEIARVLRDSAVTRDPGHPGDASGGSRRGSSARAQADSGATPQRNRSNP
ncbi:hypothetical protein ACFT30_13625 [Microbacterium ureisolvens]|uniref:hypothetical protein n=1 Tax=Microbacterium ureisolvens TaxID=2781186 RepID=UPI003627F2A1